MTLFYDSVNCCWVEGFGKWCNDMNVTSLFWWLYYMTLLTAAELRALENGEGNEFVLVILRAIKLTRRSCLVFSFVSYMLFQLFWDLFHTLFSLLVKWKIHRWIEFGNLKLKFKRNKWYFFNFFFHLRSEQVRQRVLIYLFKNVF